MSTLHGVKNRLLIKSNVNRNQRWKEMCYQAYLKAT